MASYQQLILGDLGTNCYIVWDEDSREAIVIDPADSAEIIADEILSKNLKLSVIGLTHGHFDHIMAAGELKLNFNAPIALNAKDNFLWQRQTRTAKHFTGNEFLKLGEMTKIDTDLSSVGTIKLGGKEIEIIGCPGHTPGSVAFYLPDESWLISGDLVFEEGFGTTEYGYGNVDDLRRSIEKIKQLPDETLVLPGHGGSFSLSRLG